MQLQLYITEHCHLCELAETQLSAVHPPLLWQKIEIAYDEALSARYGLSIPVLRRPDNQGELVWPFTTEQVLEFIR